MPVCVSICGGMLHAVHTIFLEAHLYLYTYSVSSASLALKSEIPTEIPCLCYLD